jgi:MurNAc alpha-1-phosphate uridylyltransferase
MRDHPDAVMLFAAGFGTRMGALTTSRPKPLIKVAGRALIDHALDQVEAAGVARKVANLHYFPEQLQTHLVDRNIAFSVETPDILETGGGLRHAMPLLGAGPVFTMNTDAVWTGENPISQLGDLWKPDKMDALLLLVEPSHAFGHSGKGDFLRSETGEIRRGSGYIYSGVQIIKTEGLAEIPDRAFSLNLLWDCLMSGGRLFGAVHSGRWCDVGRPESIAVAEAMLNGIPDV